MFIRRPSDIGLIVKAARKARSMTQEELAKRLGISRLWINEFEGGKPTARLDLVLRALAELDVTLIARTGVSESGEDIVASLTDVVIDIDAIADTGLTPSPSTNPPSPSSSSKSTRRRP